jgi:2-polyprenyl-6-methoxyphenol hydroxylase-like FAD-dependent oxidoreductase
MTSPNTKRTAIVVGGSIGGLLAALLLRKSGWQVTICERSPIPLAGRGAGIVTHRALWDSLFEAGIDPALEDGVVVDDRIAFARDGSETERSTYHQIMTSWDRLFALVREEWGEHGYHLGRELVGLSQAPDSVTATFADGSEISADLLVGADGFRSSVRQIVAPDVQPLYAGYVGWRGMVEEGDLPPDTHAAIFNIFGFCLPPGEQLITYPVVGEDHDTRPGHRRINFVWYRPADAERALPDILTDAKGHTHAISIPPPLIRPEVIDRLRGDSERLLPPHFAALVRATKAPFLQPIYDIEQDQLAFGRVVLLGDAAFQARPHVGAGVTKAALDSVALARGLAAHETIAEGLAAYEAERVPAGKRIVQRARHLGAYMQAHLATAEERAAAQRHHSPRAVIEETAVAD